MKDRLTPQQALFCAEYVIDSNGKRAAIAAGYAKKGAEVAASNLLRQAKVQETVDMLVQAMAARSLATADRVFHELSRIALSDPKELFSEDGILRKMADIPEDLRRAIASVEVDEIWKGKGDSRELVGHTSKIKLWSKTAALETLASALQLVSKRLEVTGKNGGALEVNVVNYAPKTDPVDK